MSGHAKGPTRIVEVHPPIVRLAHWLVFPLRVRIPTRLGCKTPKWITAIEVTNTNPGGYWENRGYNWVGGI